MARQLVRATEPFRSIWVGFEPDEMAAYMVTIFSIRRQLSDRRITVKPLELSLLQQKGLYKRPITLDAHNRLFDVISGHPMSTEFANSRFLVPHLAQKGWALFLDCDMLVACDMAELFRLADPRYAVMCVKHESFEATNVVKMNNQVQSLYHRKLWSSFCLFNCDHPANKALTLDLINSVPGRDLHAFCWLKDEEIGELPSEYNFLVGHDDLEECPRPKVIHFTEGTPDMPGYEDCPYSSEWRMALRRAAYYFT